MKYLHLVLMLFIINSIHAQIEWMTMNEALEAQQKKPKKIFADIYTDWCGPCKQMDKNTFSNPDLIKYVNKHYYPVKFNAEGTEKVTYQDFEYTNPNYKPDRKGKRNAQHFFAHALKVNAYPTVVFFDEESNVISPVVGYRTAEQLEIYLKMIATDAYKELNTQEAWQEYQSDFEGTFKN